MSKSIIPGDSPTWCFLCGATENLQVHHCLHGIRRKAADDNGLTVHLCATCHAKLHDHGDHDLDLEQLAQKTFEETHTRAEWMEIFGKNYLEADE